MAQSARLARYGVYRAIPVTGFPVATGVVNVLGSLAMGLLAALMAHRWNKSITRRCC